MVKFYLIVDEFLVLVDLQTEKFKVEVKVWNRVASWLIIWIVQSLHVWVFKGLLNCDPLSWVEGQHLLDQVNSLGIAVPLEEILEVFTLLCRERLHELAIVQVLNLVDQILGRLSNQVSDHHHLLLLVLGGQQWLASDQLSQDASHTPYIDGSCVLLP